MWPQVFILSREALNFHPGPVSADARPGNDKAPRPFFREMELCLYSVLGLRVSRLPDLRLVSGSISDATIRAKTLGP